MKRLSALFFAGLLAFAPVGVVAQTAQGVSISAPAGVGAVGANLIAAVNAALALPTADARLQAYRKAIRPVVSNARNLDAEGQRSLGRALAYIAAALNEIGGDEAANLLVTVNVAIQVAPAAVVQAYNDQMAAFETARNVAGYQQKRTGQTIFYPDGFGSFVNPNAGSGNTVVSPK